MPEFHLYGFILGVAIVVGWEMFFYFLKKNNQQGQERFNQKNVNWLSVSLLFGGIIGARIYHLLDHFGYYQTHLEQTWQLWQGGMSIIGAVIGGWLGGIIFFRFFNQDQKLKWGAVLDSMALSLPIAQAIGRLGNYVNQELYGWPTNGKWGVFIRLENRVLGFENFSYFHPLFLYEIFFLLLFCVLVKFVFSGLKLGEKGYFYLYLFYYSLIRFFLDFIRIDKIHLFDTFLGINQIILILVALVSGRYFFMKYWKKR